MKKSLICMTAAAMMFATLMQLAFPVAARLIQSAE